MKRPRTRESSGVRHQPSKAELLREVKTLRSQQELMVEEIKQLLASVSVYRNLADLTLRRRYGSLYGNGHTPLAAEPETVHDGALRNGRSRRPE
jgi:hypothetical protein